MKRLKQVLAALLCLTGCAPAPAPAPRVPEGTIQRWAVYYDHARPATDFKDLDLVIFDRRAYPAFKEIQPKTKVLAYIPIGEIYDDVPERKKLEKKKLLLYQNPIWKSHAVDVTSPVWHRIVLGYVKDAEKKGFDGVMLDTIDSPLYWAETKQPEKLKLMQSGAVALIKSIRKAHPNMKIMLNRGFQILPRVADQIDYVLAESIMTNTDLSTGQFALLSRNDFDQAAGQLRNVVVFAPHLQLLTLDYWNQEDAIGLERLYAAQRAEGFVPYVTTPDLRTYTPEPGAPPSR